VTGRVIDVNPAHGVRGPKFLVKQGKTLVLTAEGARALRRAFTPTLAGGVTIENRHF